MRFFEWNSCLLFSPKGERENNCALQYASFVISNFSVFPDVLVWIWSIHWNVKSDSTWRVRLKCMATSQVCLFYIIICIYFFSCLFCIIICIFFSCDKLTNKWVCLCHCVSELAYCRLQTIRNKSSLRLTHTRHKSMN